MNDAWRDNPGVEVWRPLFFFDVQLARPRNTVFLGAQIHFQRPKKYKRMIILVWNCGRSVASCLAPPLIICCSNSHVSAQTTNDWKDIPVSPTLNFSLCSSQVACFDMFICKKIVLKRLIFFLKVWLAVSRASLTVIFFFWGMKQNKGLRAVDRTNILISFEAKRRGNWFFALICLCVSKSSLGTTPNTNGCWETTFQNWFSFI